MLSAFLSVLLLAAMPKSCEDIQGKFTGDFIKSNNPPDAAELEEKLPWILMLYRSSHEVNPSWEKDDPNRDFENKRLLKIDECQKELWPSFYTEGGIKYLTETLRVQRDQSNMLAILEVLSASQQPSTLQVFEEFSKHPNKVVAKVSTTYLKRAQKRAKP
jgi:hypothetical protein